MLQPENSAFFCAAGPAPCAAPAPLVLFRTSGSRHAPPAALRWSPLGLREPQGSRFAASGAGRPSPSLGRRLPSHAASALRSAAGLGTLRFPRRSAKPQGGFAFFCFLLIIKCLMCFVETQCIASLRVEWNNRIELQFAYNVYSSGTKLQIAIPMFGVHYSSATCRAGERPAAECCERSEQCIEAPANRSFRYNFCYAKITQRPFLLRQRAKRYPCAAAGALFVPAAGARSARDHDAGPTKTTGCK